MATQLLSLSSLMANFLRLPTHLIPETAIFLPFIIVNHLLGFLISVLKNLKYQLPIAFSGWLARSKHRLIYLYCGFWLFILWLLNQFNVRLNLHSHLLLQVVLVILLTCIVWLSSSDSLVESNIDSQIVQYIFNEDNQLSFSRSYDTAQTEDLFGLQEDLLTEIVNKLHAFHDFAFCSTVCKDWRSACSNLKWSLYPPHPWSIYFQGQSVMNHLDDGRYVLERWTIDGRDYYGCVNGWILSIGSKHISIFNPFSRTQRNLPILSRVGYLSITKPSEWYHYIDNILFKACHGDNLQFFVVALFGARGFIIFTGPQFQDWICIESDDIACCSDVVLFRGRFYALCGRGKLFLCTFDRSNPCVSLVSQQPAGSFRADKYYLVKNLDHLIAVFQDRNWDSGVKRFGTKTFSIYRSDGSSRYWTRLREPIYLEGRALFISNGNSWTIDPEEVENCRTNSIYFVDDYWFSNNKDGHFIGVFDIANGEIEDFQFEMDQYPPNDVSPFSLTDNVGA